MRFRSQIGSTFTQRARTETARNAIRVLLRSVRFVGLRRVFCSSAIWVGGARSSRCYRLPLNRVDIYHTLRHRNNDHGRSRALEEDLSTAHVPHPLAVKRCGAPTLPLPCCRAPSHLDADQCAASGRQLARLGRLKRCMPLAEPLLPPTASLHIRRDEREGKKEAIEREGGF
jgi:hypothetical protein